MTAVSAVLRARRRRFRSRSVNLIPAPRTRWTHRSGRIAGWTRCRRTRSPPTTTSSAGLQRVRLEAGVSYRELHRRIARDRRRRGIPEVPAYDTVYRCLQTGRTRLDLDLVLDVVRALGGGRGSAHAPGARPGRRRPDGGWSSPTGDAAPLRDIRTADAVDLVGRGAELTRLLDRPGPWLVTGMPGVGKSALAVAAAVALLRSGRADGALRIQLNAYADLPVPSASTVTEALLLRLGTPAEDVAGTIWSSVAP